MNEQKRTHKTHAFSLLSHDKHNNSAISCILVLNDDAEKRSQLTPLLNKKV